MQIHYEIADLRRLNVKQLRARYAEVFGESTTANNKTWIVKRIAWRVVVHFAGSAAVPAAGAGETPALQRQTVPLPPGGCRLWPRAI